MENNEVVTSAVELVDRNGIPCMTLSQIASLFGKEKFNVAKSLEILDASLLKDVEVLKDNRGYTIEAYLPERAALMLVTGFTGEKAAKIRLACVDAFIKIRQIKEDPMSMFEGMKPEAMEFVGSKLLELAKVSRVVREQAVLLEEAKPKIAFAEAVGESSSLILVRDLAKLIQRNGVDIGEKRLFIWMRNEGYLTKQNAPTQRAMDLGVLTPVEQVICIQGETITKFTTKVTGKGQQYFLNKFIK